jgi:DNA repair protein RadC
VVAQPHSDVKPSEQDKLLIRLVLAAETVHLRVLDHLIDSPDEAFSFRKAGPL